MAAKKPHFDILTRNIKYLGINLTKEVLINYLAVKKDIEKEVSGSIYHVHGLE